MNRKKNLFLAAFLLGSMATLLPFLLKIFLFVSVGIFLFMTYDEWEYSKRIEESRYE